MNNPLKSIEPEKSGVIDEFLEFLPEQEEILVELPTGMHLYNLPDPNKPVTLRPMNFEDEKALASKKGEVKDAVSFLLSRCTSNLKISELTGVDMTYLMYKLREISVGSDYKILIECQHCENSDEVTLDISKDFVTVIPESELEDPRIITLPKLKKRVQVRFARQKDNAYLSEDFKNLWRFVVAIEPKEGQWITDSVIRSKVVDKLPREDAHAVIREMRRDELGLDTKFMFSCSKCKKESLTQVPVSADFFSPS